LPEAGPDGLLSGSLSGRSRHRSRAQTPPAQQPPAQQTQPAPVTHVFDSDGGLVLNFIKPDKTADFEAVMAKLKEALQKSDKPERKQMAQGWKVFKSLDPAANGNALYVFVIDPAAKGADYTVSTILTQAFPEQANELLTKYAGAYATGQNFVKLALVNDLGK